jgi:DNA repair protein RadA/Sms
VFFGEVGLAGEVRAVGQTEARVKEAAKLGFEQVFLPTGGRQGARRSPAQDGLRIQEIRRLDELRALLGCDDDALPAAAARPSIARAGPG